MKAFEVPGSAVSEEPLAGLFQVPPSLREKVLEIASRLEALQEYNKKQAIFVAADIVRRRFLKTFAATSSPKE